VNQPRAIGALPALDEGFNLLLSRPALFGLTPCLVLFIRFCFLGLTALVGAAYGLDQWFWESSGSSLFEVSDDTWAWLGIAASGLLLAEHLAVTLLIKVLPVTLRNHTWQLGEVWSVESLVVTAVLRLALYVSVVMGILLAGVGVLLALPFAYAPFFAADLRLGVFASTARGFRLVVSHFGTVLLFEFIALGLLITGFLVCGLGVLPAYLVTTASRAALYDQLATSSR
jgi:hypothetical protein